MGYGKNIICPYCGREYDGEVEDVVTCGDCEREFNVEINITYTISRIKCEDKKHDYQLVDVFIQKREIKKGEWGLLAEADWLYFKVLECKHCADKQFVPVPKDYYTAFLLDMDF